MNDLEAKKLSTAVYRMSRKYGTENIVISVKTPDPDVGGELIWTAAELIERYVTEAEKDRGKSPSN